MKDELLMLYDGKCNICNAAVRFTLPRVKPGSEIKYASLQSQFARDKLESLGANCFEDKKNPDVPTTSAVIYNGKVYTKIAGSAITLKHLQFPWPILAFLIALLPVAVGNFAYEAFASRRFDIFGGTDTVQAIPESKEHLFLDRDEGIHACPMPKKAAANKKAK